MSKEYKFCISTKMTHPLSSAAAEEYKFCISTKMTHPRSSAAAEGSEGSAVESPEQGLRINRGLGADRLRAVERLVEQPVVEPAREERQDCARNFFEAAAQLHPTSPRARA